MSDNGKIIYNVGPRIHCHWLPKWPGIFDSVSPLYHGDINFLSACKWLHSFPSLAFPFQHFDMPVDVCNMASKQA